MNTGGRIMPAPVWDMFGDFISPDADRAAILEKVLNVQNIEFKTAEISGYRHFIITPPRAGQNRRRTILTAHYDRAAGSPGANDNSAAVFILAETAASLVKGKKDGWTIIFTDGEELSHGEGIADQGSYSLALSLKGSEPDYARIFNFDACGTGDTMIISTTVDYLLKNENTAGTEKLRAAARELRNIALETARDLHMEKVLLAPTPFSDDAGFLMAGTAAQTITMLPSQECALLVSSLRKDPNFTDTLVNLELRNAQNHNTIPETWRIFNSPSDSRLRLTPRSFKLVQKFAQALCG